MNKVNNELVTIKYFDRINGKVISLEITKEQSAEMKKLDNYERKQKYHKIKNEISFDTLIKKAEKNERGICSFDELVCEEQFYDKEIREQIKKIQIGKFGEMIKGLPHKQALVIKLKFVDGLSFKKIANTLNCSKTNIIYLYQRAIASLKKNIRDRK